MKQKLYINGFFKIKNNTVWSNGELIFKRETEPVSAFLKAFYKKQNLQYPKFFKMDTLSKLAFLSAEKLLQEARLLNFQNTALVFSNQAASLDTDRKHQQSISGTESFPSPAVFVYTLPNIGLGEISIRHTLQSENAFFVFEEFNPKFLNQYAESLLASQKCDSVLCGWVNVDGEEYESFLYLTSKTGDQPLTLQTINNLYQN